ncbi:hypothetical protein I316_07459 [Kwoniella heveanensis BCC8398]|uniref:Uncharacterized protein n=1 Tax=Kwoniella heveanensis BCC8398 TaxID=1296120 RepID=A0A1B9GIX6_9TREE|nr:hypothetical protein I316_07459 [Kwoniella heveanensis BCC8398]
MTPRSAATRLLARAGSSKHASASVLARAASTSSSTPSASSSSSSSSSWEPALPTGASPAYDAALSFLSEHQNSTLSKLRRLQSKVDSSNPESNPELLRRIDQLEVDAYANDPAVRRVFRETGGKGQMDKTIYRWLGEQKWKKEGGLDLLMQRVLQMNVVPDLLPEIPPTAPLALSLHGSYVEPGSVQKPSIFQNPPTLKSQIFHHPSYPSASNPNPEALHTLLVIDPDSPSHETHSFSQRLHYLKTDIPLSVTSGDVNLADSSVGSEVLRWEPPAPEQGTPKHRYVFLLFRQYSSIPSTSASAPASRENFDLRGYLSERGLTASHLVGINMFRSAWSAEEDQFINSVFVEHRGVQDGAPVFGKVPKEVKYGYPMSAKRQRIEEAREEAWERAVTELKGLAEDVGGIVQDVPGSEGKVRV